MSMSDLVVSRIFCSIANGQGCCASTEVINMLSSLLELCIRRLVFHCNLRVFKVCSKYSTQPTRTPLWPTGQHQAFLIFCSPLAKLVVTEGKSLIGPRCIMRPQASPPPVTLSGRRYPQHSHCHLDRLGMPIKGRRYQSLVKTHPDVCSFVRLETDQTANRSRLRDTSSTS